LDHLQLHLDHLQVHLDHLQLCLDHLQLHLDHLQLHLDHLQLHLDHLQLHFHHTGGFFHFHARCAVFPDTAREQKSTWVDIFIDHRRRAQTGEYSVQCTGQAAAIFAHLRAWRHMKKEQRDQENEREARGTSPKIGRAGARLPAGPDNIYYFIIYRIPFRWEQNSRIR